MHIYATRDLGDRTLAFLDVGTGSPVVFLHAFPLNAEMWRPQLQALPDGWRAIAPDLRGFQHSRRGGGPPARHVRDHAADVLALITGEAGDTPAVIVGLSFGGYIAFECWRQRPELVRALVLADTRAEADTEEARQKRVEMQGHARAEGPSAIADLMLPKLLGGHTQTTDPHRGTEVRRLIESNTSEAIVDALDALASRPDSRPTLASITCQTLVIVGEDDELTPPAMADTIAQGIAGATLVTIPRAGHLSNLEQPVVFNAALHEWMKLL